MRMRRPRIPIESCCWGRIGDWHGFEVIRGDLPPSNPCAYPIPVIQCEVEGTDAMNHEMDILDEGAICAFTVGGRVDPAELLSAMRASAMTEELQASFAYFVDLSRAELSHLTFAELRTFSESRNELRAMFQDDKPVAVFAPSAILYGLMRIVAAFDRSPIEIFRTESAALKWLRDQIGALSVGSTSDSEH